MILLHIIFTIGQYMLYLQKTWLKDKTSRSLLYYAIKIQDNDSRSFDSKNEIIIFDFGIPILDVIRN